MLWLKVQVTVTKAVWAKTDPGHSVSCTLGKKVMTQVKSLSAKIFLSHADYHLWDICPSPLPSSLMWRHNGHDGVSNHQLHDCLLNCLFRRGSKKTSKLRVTGLCAGNSPVTGEFPAQRPVTRKMFPFDDFIMYFGNANRNIWSTLATMLSDWRFVWENAN